jgi:hypothetical protein
MKELMDLVHKISVIQKKIELHLIGDLKLSEDDLSELMLVLNDVEMKIKELL